MRILYYISIIILLLGICAIPGCIEFENGIVQTIVMIVAGAAGVIYTQKGQKHEAIKH